MKITRHISHFMRIKAICFFLSRIKVVCPLKMVCLRFRHEIVSAIVFLHVFWKSTLWPSLIRVSMNSAAECEDSLFSKKMQWYSIHSISHYCADIVQIIYIIQINNNLLFLFSRMGSQRQYVLVKAHMSFLKDSIQAQCGFWKTLHIASQKDDFIEWMKSEPSFRCKTICIWA